MPMAKRPPSMKAALEPANLERIKLPRPDFRRLDDAIEIVLRMQKAARQNVRLP
jgi:hypothetical protein